MQNSEHILQRVRATTSGSALLRASPRGAWQGACQTARASGLALAASRKKTGALGKKTGTLGEEDGNSPRASQKRPCVPKLRIPYVYYHPESYLTPVLCNTLFRRPPPDPLYSRAGCTTLVTPCPLKMPPPSPRISREPWGWRSREER